jgi:hypothetical protein
VEKAGLSQAKGHRFYFSYRHPAVGKKSFKQHQEIVHLQEEATAIR